MARRKSRNLTEVELEFMQVVWEAGEATTDDVGTALREKGRDLSDGTIRKMLSILLEKGYVTRRARGRGHVYRAKVPPDRAEKGMVTDLVDRVFGGSPALMVASLLESRDVKKKDLAEIKKLIAEQESEGKK